VLTKSLKKQDVSSLLRMDGVTSSNPSVTILLDLGLSSSGETLLFSSMDSSVSYPYSCLFWCT
jgi:hypothetical protein